MTSGDDFYMLSSGMVSETKNCFYNYVLLLFLAGCTNLCYSTRIVSPKRWRQLKGSVLLPPSDPLVLWPQKRPFAKECMRKPIPPVVRGFVTRVCTVFGQFCTEGITFSGGSRPSDRGGEHPDPEIRGVWSQKPFFSTLWASVWSKNKGGPGPLP